MSCARPGLRRFGVDRTALIEVIFEIIFEIVFELVGEALVEAGWRTADVASRDALGRQQAGAVQRWLGLSLTMAVVAGVGVWRGATVGGLGWGWWFALAVAIAATTATVGRAFRPAGPRPGRLAALTWWPIGRCIWFAVANGTFVVAYALAAAAADNGVPVLR
ncbi:hypothetical protein BH10ACT3_BH10ACT3_13910 [soil metagenome]